MPSHEQKLQGEWQEHLAGIRAEHNAIIDSAKDIVRTLAEMAMRYRMSQAQITEKNAEQSVDKSAEASDESADEPPGVSDTSEDKTGDGSEKSAEGDDKSSAEEDRLDYHSFVPVNDPHAF